MALTRAVTSSIDRFAARLAYITERVTTLERSSHRHNTPATALQPVGSVQHFIGTTPPDGWVELNGQTITNGETLYPALWAVLPATMKSGANIVLPDCRGRVIVHEGTSPFNTFGATTGASTVTLSANELPSHSHGVGSLAASNSGNLFMSGSTSISGSTTGSGQHGHTGVTGTEPGHDHGIGAGAQLWFGGAPPQGYGQVNPTLAAMRLSGGWITTGSQAGQHFHGVIIPNTTGDHSHGVSASGSVSVSGGSHGHTLSGATGAAGSGQAHSNVQPSLVLSTILKVV